MNNAQAVAGGTETARRASLDAHGPQSEQPIIAAINLHKRFGGVRAVAGCSLSAFAGQVTGLIGPNGAGKSTLLGLLAGAVKPDAGSIHFDGADVTRLSDWRRARIGLIRTFQVSRPFGQMTVVENMLMGSLHRSGETFRGAVLGRRSWAATENADLERAVDLLRRFNLLRLANDYANTLSGGQMRLLELARALMSDPKLLLLDEPFAGVNPTLAQELADHVEGLKEAGLAMILIEHELSLVGRLCDPVIVMAEGSVLAQGSMEELAGRADVLDAYLGRTRPGVDASAGGQEGGRDDA